MHGHTNRFGSLRRGLTRLHAGVAAAAVAALLAAPAPSSAAVKQFLANINSGQETPVNASVATGVAHLNYDTVTKLLCFSITHTAAGEIAAHIHGPALPGVPAGIVFGLPAGPAKSGCTAALTSAQKKDLYNNLLYINIHTGAFPGGEIRGQILRIK